MGRHVTGYLMTLEEAWRQFGYSIIADCCEEWIMYAKLKYKYEYDYNYWDKMLHTYTSKKYKDRARYKRNYAARQKQTMDACMKLCEKWLDSDLCYSICGFTGEELVQNMKERLPWNTRRQHRER